MLKKKIHLNQELYEFYPFLYFIFGTAFYLLINGHEVLRIISLAACFGAGFIALLVRSRHRCLERTARVKTDKRLWFPRPVYEAIPVIYIAAGILLLASTRHVIAYISGLALVTAGCYFLFSRIMHRVLLARF